MSRLGMVIGGVLMLLALVGAGIYAYFHLPYDDQATAVTFNVQTGETLQKTANRLAEAGLVRFPELYALLARAAGRDRQIRAGEYDLHTSMSPQEILDRLCRGSVILYKVTVPEGLTFNQVGRVLEENDLAQAEAFDEVCRDRGFVTALGFEGETLEGYLFPETYFFARGLSPREIARVMTDRFRSVFGPELRRRQEEAEWSLLQTVTLASIVEKETGLQEEKPLVASVLINRLKRGMLLQCDPTVIYGLEAFDGNLTREDLRTPNPYNTYVNKGLPPGPICNPGLGSLEAVLSPARTAYLYFVSRNDGSHVFTTNLEDHNQAVQTYQIRGNKGASGRGS